jgi:rhodanese-related sulfurtransferase
MTRLTPLHPADLQAGLAAGHYRIVDVRERDEFARVHIADAISLPLSGWDRAPFDPASERQPVFMCRSGARTAGACDRLAARVSGDAFVLEGGLDAWLRAGLPVVRDRKAPIELMRQVQIAAGTLILLGVLLGWIVAPVWFGLAAFVGAGLVFAGVTGFCGMARLLLHAPWNRRPAV